MCSSDLPDMVLAPMVEALKSHAPAKEFLEKRGVTEQSISDWEIGWVEEAGRIAIPVRDVNKDLRCISGRILGKGTPKWVHSKGFKKERHLYGEDRIESDGTGTCVIVEGFFDVIFLTQIGVRNALAVMGSSLSRYQKDKVVRMFNRAVIVPDGDGPGKEAAKQIHKALKVDIDVHVYPTPDGKDPDELPLGSVQDFIESCES